MTKAAASVSKPARKSTPRLGSPLFGVLSADRKEVTVFCRCLGQFRGAVVDYNEIDRRALVVGPDHRYVEVKDVQTAQESLRSVQAEALQKFRARRS